MRWQRLEQPYLSHLYQSFKDEKAHLKQAMKIYWRKQNKDYRPEHDIVNKLDRDQHSRIYRLTAGCSGLRTPSLNGHSASATLLCRAPRKTPEYILADCVELTWQKKKTLPTGETLQVKPCGISEDMTIVRTDA